VSLSVITDQNCKDTIEHFILVHPVPEADFTVTPDLLIYPATTIAITNNKAVSGYSYEWKFGDESDSLVTLNPGSHTYEGWGDYSIQLRAFTAWCENFRYRDVRIIPPVPIASFTTDTVSGCPPLKISFHNTSQFSDAYTWDFGDEQSKSGKNQEYIYDVPGQYLVSLIARGDGGADTIATTIITVYEMPEIIFSFDPSTVTAPGYVTFTDSSRNVSEWIWEFGTGDTSHLRHPVYQYREEGTWDVTLTATSEHQCQLSKTVREAVVVKKDVELRVANAFSPNQFGPPAQPLTGDDLALNFNAVFIPQYKGVDEKYYTFQVFNRWGEQIFETHDIRIGWDGYFKDRLCPQGVYVWKVKYRSLDGQGFEKMGDVTLYR
jgi:PKD repeat protein